MPTTRDVRTSARGRPRSERSRQAILSAAMSLLSELGYRNVTVEAIAARAGAGKQTIYRWWPNKASVLLDALAEHAASAIAMPDSGDWKSDLVAYLTRTFDVLQQTGPVVRSLMAEAQLDTEFAQAFRTRFITSRRDRLRTLLRDARDRNAIGDWPSDEILLDLIYGAIWYRLLVGHAPLDHTFAQDLTDVIASTLTCGEPVDRGRPA